MGTKEKPAHGCMSKKICNHHGWQFFTERKPVNKEAKWQTCRARSWQPVYPCDPLFHA
jgi:hypothetical protein